MAVERGPDSRVEPRLDALARSLAGEPVSRRTTLKGAAVVAGGAAVSSPLWGWAERAAAAVAHKPRCKHGHASCGHGCCKPNQVCVHPKRKKPRARSRSASASRRTSSAHPGALTSAAIRTIAAPAASIARPVRCARTGSVGCTARPARLPRQLQRLRDRGPAADRRRRHLRRRRLRAAVHDLRRDGVRRDLRQHADQCLELRRVRLPGEQPLHGCHLRPAARKRRSMLGERTVSHWSLRSGRDEHEQQHLLRDLVLQSGTASCGTNGTCQHDGSACALYSSETQCEPALCNANTGQFTPYRFCDGAGTCSPANAMDCAPYTCEGSGCLTSCEGPDDCIPSATCESGMCAAGM